MLEDTRATDRGEPTTAMEPMLLPEGSPHRAPSTDLAVELVAASAGFRRSLPEGVRSALADLVRSVNCYYSNLIEGHDTHPVDIERALQEDYSRDRRKRDLQLEARAHIEVQRWIDAGEVAAIVGTTDRHARRTVSSLLEKGILSSGSPREPLRLAFPAALAPRWMPGLFPEKPT